MSATNEMSWEVCKENVQPLRTGRNVSYLNAGLQISEETSQNLMMEKKKLEEEILSEANKQDPIDPWDRYFKWIQQHNPNGKDGKSLENFLQKYIIKFRDFERYKNDPRYVDAWLTMSQLHDDALVTFAYMHSNHIGVTCASFYVMWAEELEKYGNTKKADAIYDLGEQKKAQPAEVLLKMKNAFQLRVARSISMKINDEDQNEVENTRPPQRRALGSLDGKGKQKVVGSTRIGRNTSGAPTKPHQHENRGNKIKIYSDEGNEPAPPSGAFTTVPSSQTMSKENKMDASIWKGAKVQQHHRKPPSTKPQAFTIYQDKDTNPEHPTPTPSRKISRSVENILTERKWGKNVESDFHRSIRESHGDVDTNVVRMYPVEKVYSAVGEYQPEEILAAYWFKRQRKEQEVERDLELQNQLETQRQQIEQQERTNMDIKRQLLHREAQLKELLKQLKENEAKASGEQRRELEREEVEMTVVLKDVCSQLRCLNDHNQQQQPMQPMQSQLQPQQQQTQPQHFKHQIQPQQPQQMPHFQPQQSQQPQPQLKQQSNEEKVGEVETRDFPSLDGLSLADEVGKPSYKMSSPTVCTKQAMGEILDMFQQPLSREVPQPLPEPPAPTLECSGKFEIFCDSKSIAETTEKIPIFRDQQSESTKKFEIFCDENETEVGKGNFQIFDENKSIHQPSGKFEIFCDDSSEKTPVKFQLFEDAENSDNSENIPTPDYKQAPKRTNLSGILQPAVGFELQGSDDEDEEEKYVDGVKLLPTDNQTIFLDDRIVAGGPVVQPANQHNESTFFQPLSHDDQGLQSFVNKDDFADPHFSAESTTRWSGGAAGKTEEVTQSGAAKLSPILEATSEYDKSSVGVKYQPGLTSTLNPTLHTINPSSPEKFRYNMFGVEEDITMPEFSHYDEQSQLDYDVSNLCDGLLASSLRHPEITEQGTDIGDNETVSHMGIYLIPDPWDKELLRGVISRSLDDVGVGEKKVFRKGGAVTIGSETYNLAREIGKGAYAKAYQATNSCGEEVAIKAQTPAYPWEIYILKEVSSRITDGQMRSYYMSMIHAAIYTNSSCIVYNYMGNGTLLDFVNTNCHNPIHHTRIAHQILQMVHTLHQINIIHGDVKPDNIMVVSTVKSPLGLVPTLRLIDFGQSIDLAALPPNSAFTYNVGTSGFVCSQMKMNQPWNYHIDFNGIAGTLHVVLHRAYMKTYQNDVGEWVTTKRLPRVCQDRWKKAFHDLLNFPTPSDEWSPSIHDSPLPNLIQLFDV